jgi:hypothetical protein
MNVMLHECLPACLFAWKIIFFKKINFKKINFRKINSEKINYFLIFGNVIKNKLKNTFQYLVMSVMSWKMS